MYRHHRRNFFRSALDKAEHTLAASHITMLAGKTEEDVEHGVHQALNSIEDHARSFTIDHFKDDLEVQTAIAEEAAKKVQQEALSKRVAQREAAEKRAVKKPAAKKSSSTE